MNKKNENIIDDNVFYFFVTLNELENPEYHIVPSHIVAKEIKESHKKWLDTPGRNGQQHNDNPMRKFEDLDDEYLNNWKCLY